MSDTFSVGKRLLELCRENKYLEALDELYSPEIVSIEPQSDPEHPGRVEGIDAVRAKNKAFYAQHEVHNAEGKGPWPHGDRFIVEFSL